MPVNQSKTEMKCSLEINEERMNMKVGRQEKSGENISIGTENCEYFEPQKLASVLLAK